MYDWVRPRLVIQLMVKHVNRFSPFLFLLFFLLNIEIRFTLFTNAGKPRIPGVFGGTFILKRFTAWRGGVYTVGAGLSV